MKENDKKIRKEKQKGENSTQSKKRKNPWYRSWVFILIVCIIAWPIGMILLFLRLSDMRREKEAMIPKEVFRSYSSEKSESENEESRKIEQSTLNAIKMSRIVVPVIILVAGASLTYHILEMIRFGFSRDLFFQIVINIGWLMGAVILASICIRMSRRQKRFCSYMDVIRKQRYIPVAVLCNETGYSAVQVREDLEEMNKRLYFSKDAHFGEDNRIFYL